MAKTFRWEAKDVVGVEQESRAVEMSIESDMSTRVYWKGKQ